MSLLNLHLESGLALSENYYVGEPVIIPKREGFTPNPFAQPLVLLASIRHGEPEQFAEEQSGLTLRGFEDIRAYTTDLVAHLEFLSIERQKNVRFLGLTSPIPRAVISAATQRQQLLIERERRGFDELIIKNEDFRRCGNLDGRGTLRPFIEQLAEKEKAHSAWLDAPEEKHQELGSRSPKQVFISQLSLLIPLWYRSFSLGAESIWLVSLVGHETGNSSVLRRFYPQLAYNIGFVGEGEIRYQFDVNGISGIYKGNEFRLAEYDG